MSELPTLREVMQEDEYNASVAHIEVGKKTKVLRDTIRKRHLKAQTRRLSDYGLRLVAFAEHNNQQAPAEGTWRGRAACRGVDTEIFVVNSSYNQAQRTTIQQIGLRICAVCTVRPECLDEAVRVVDRESTRGGKTADELQTLLAGIKRPEFG